jgi:hypothetical protein
LYRNYPLSEGALVAETCNLIYANLSDVEDLQCEVQYTKLLPRDADSRVLASRARADLVISETLRKRGAEPVPKFIIEVKRASAPRSQIDADLCRLAAARGARADVRAFMFVIAEAKRPNRFVDKEGKSRLGKNDIHKPQGYYRVRRTWKAAHAFSHVDRAQYACLLEVYCESS